ncbi:hypothetical protein Q3A86_32985 [Streptomyces sp. NBUA17]|uniref:hypothetical protein n=1 Tax=Streptomyces sp. NBUA17 TaxID=3062275 RepID=UPI0037D9AE1A
MRDEHRVIVLAKACAIVGIALAAFGIIADRTTEFRSGMLILLVSSAAAVQLTQREHLRQAMAHTARVARLTARERQQWAEYGWRAAQIDALTEDTPETAGGAEVVGLPHPRHTPQMRRNGSA